MSTTEQKEPKAPVMGLDVAVSDEGSSSAVAGDESSAGVKTGRDSQGVEFNNDGTVKPTGIDGVKEWADKEEDAEDDTTATETSKEDSKSEDAGAPEDLGDYNSEDPEVVSKFEARYFKDDGENGQVLNTDAFNEELAANLAADPENFNINASSRKFLKDRLGISDALIDNHLKGIKAQTEVNDAAFYATPTVGGKEAYEAKLAWGKENYTPAQKEKFNAAIKAGGDSALEAVELLALRYASANKDEGQAGDQKVPAKSLGRPVSPKKDVTSSATAGRSAGVEPFASADDHRKALKAAKNDAERDVVRKRLRVSPWFKAGQNG